MAAIYRTGIQLQLCIVSILGFQSARHCGVMKVGFQTQSMSIAFRRAFGGGKIPFSDQMRNSIFRPDCHQRQLPPYFAFRRLMMSNNKDDADRKRISENLFRSLNLDDHQRAYVESLQQGSKEWLMARKYRLTASNFGTAVGHNPFKSPDELVQDMLFENFKGNDATQWGNQNEDVARSQYIERQKRELSSIGLTEFHVSESGLHICRESPWMAASPDGHVHEAGENGLLEIKCPYSKRLYPEIPPYYMDQIQGIMGIIGYKWTDFVVWTPTEMSIQRVPFDERYWLEKLYPALQDFYFNRFIPAFVQNVLHPRVECETSEEVQQDTIELPEITSDKRANEEIVLRESLESVIISTQTLATPGTDNLQQATVLQTNVLEEATVLQTSYLREELGVSTAGADLDECWISTPVSTSSSAHAELENIDSQSEVHTTTVSGEKMMELNRFLPAVKQLLDQLERNNLRLELLGSSNDSGFTAFLTQLFRQGLLPLQYHEYIKAWSSPDVIQQATDQIRYDIMQHMTKCMPDVLASTKTSPHEFFSRFSLYRSIGSAGLAAAADLFGVHIICLLLSHKGVQERHFYPSLRAGPDSLPSARGRIVLCTTGSWFWSTTSLTDPRQPATTAASPVSPPNVAPASAIAPPIGGGLSQAPQSGPGPVVEANTASRSNTISPLASSPAAAAAADLPTAADPAAQGEAFSSRYSPLFQQCVLDVEAKSRAEGADALSALRKAFAICKKSVGDRRFGEHAVRKDGRPVADVEGTAARYQALLVQYQLTLINHLRSTGQQ